MYPRFSSCRPTEKLRSSNAQKWGVLPNNRSTAVSSLLDQWLTLKLQSRSNKKHWHRVCERFLRECNTGRTTLLNTSLCIHSEIREESWWKGKKNKWKPTHSSVCLSWLQADSRECKSRKHSKWDCWTCTSTVILEVYHLLLFLLSWHNEAMKLCVSAPSHQDTSLRLLR